MKVEGMSGLNIYLAEDDIDDVNFFRQALNKICGKSTCAVCNNGEEMLELLEGSKDALPDVIILDINMPVMNGQECLEQIRARPYLKNVPVVMLTTSSSRNTIEAAYKAGASLYVKKPVIFEDLETIISTIIRMNWAQQPQPEISKFIYNPKSR